MGNLCSKSANKPDNFSTPGRSLGSANQNQPSSAPVPQKVKTGTPGRTLGSRDGASSPDDARGAAAKAAEARAATGSKGGGKLSANLASQKKQTQNQVLSQGSEQERRARDADSTAQAQAYN